jgi:methyltransferase-like protein/2-polyprenyl-3-methyl-5-hydroxy-6-metoxy-1,4-benzoquinol methylase
MNSYEEIPYLSKPHYPMHPDCLGTLGLLFGMQPAPASRCRVLELGCATGMNIICLAEAYPQSEFVGVDLSPSQIETGNDLIRRAGLKNVRLQAASIMDVDESWGEFDYVLSHGVFSWVPQAVQEKILELSRKLLKPQGIAYISYNTYPGWHLRNIVRDLMRYHSRSFEDSMERVQQALALLQFMAKNAPDATSPYSRILAREADILSHAPESYVFHEHLEDVNTPVYFHQFVERAAKHQLQYMGEAWQHTLLDEFPADVRETLQGISDDLIQLEQYADFLTNRTFRRSLLIHADVKIDRAPDEAVIAQLYASALAEPTTPAPDIHSTEPVTFKIEHGASISVSYPIVKAALGILYRESPRAIPFMELFERSLSAIDNPTNVAEQRAILATILLRGHLAHFVLLLREPFVLESQVKERPVASVLARLLAPGNTAVPSRRHKLVPLPLFERALLTLTDGTRSIPQLVDDLIAVTNEGQNRDRNEVADRVQDSLEGFARQGILVG